MKRRDFIALGGGAVVAWPFATRAQRQPMPKIGFLRSTSIAASSHLLAAFRAGLREAGFLDGENVVIEYRSAEDHPDQLSALVTELIRLPVAVIVGNVDSALAANTTVSQIAT